MVIKIAAIAGFIAVIGFGVYFFWLSPAPAPIVQIPVPSTPEQPPEPFITPPVKPGSFFAEAPITRSLPPGFEFQKIGEGEESFETLGVVSELPTPEEQTTQELEALGLDPLLTRELPEIQWPSFESLVAIQLPSGPSQQQLDSTIGNIADSLINQGFIDSNEKKEILNRARTTEKALEQIVAIGTDGQNQNTELDNLINFSNNYVDDLIARGLLAPEEKQNAVEAVKASAAVSLSSQSNALGPLENLPQY